MLPLNYRPHRDLVLFLVTPPKRLKLHTDEAVMLYQIRGDCGLTARQLNHAWQSAAPRCCLPTGSYHFDGDWAHWFFRTRAMPTRLYRKRGLYRDPVPLGVLTPDYQWTTEKATFAQARLAMRDLGLTPPLDLWIQEIEKRLDAFPGTLVTFIDAVL